MFYSLPNCNTSLKLYSFVKCYNENGSVAWTLINALVCDKYPSCDFPFCRGKEGEGKECCAQFSGKVSLAFSAGESAWLPWTTTSLAKQMTQSQDIWVMGGVLVLSGIWGAFFVANLVFFIRVTQCSCSFRAAHPAKCQKESWVTFDGKGWKPNDELKILAFPKNCYQPSENNFHPKENGKRRSWTDWQKWEEVCAMNLVSCGNIDSLLVSKESTFVWF